MSTVSEVGNSNWQRTSHLASTQRAFRAESGTIKSQNVLEQPQNGAQPTQQRMSGVRILVGAQMINCYTFVSAASLHQSAIPPFDHVDPIASEDRHPKRSNTFYQYEGQQSPTIVDGDVLGLHVFNSQDNPSAHPPVVWGRRSQAYSAVVPAGQLPSCPTQPTPIYSMRKATAAKRPYALPAASACRMHKPTRRIHRRVSLDDLHRYPAADCSNGQFSSSRYTEPLGRRTGEIGHARKPWREPSLVRHAHTVRLRVPKLGNGPLRSGTAPNDVEQLLLGRFDDDPSATAPEQIAAPRDCQRALLDEGPERIDDQRRILIGLRDRPRRKPFGERALTDLVAHRFPERVQFPALPLGQYAFIDSGGRILCHRLACCDCTCGVPYSNCSSFVGKSLQFDRLTWLLNRQSFQERYRGLGMKCGVNGVLRTVSACEKSCWLQQLERTTSGRQAGQVRRHMGAT